MKYGINQCIGDTIGPGGIFKALRTGPAWLDILHDAEQLCQRAKQIVIAGCHHHMAIRGLERLVRDDLHHARAHAAAQVAGRQVTTDMGIHPADGGLEQRFPPKRRA